MKRAFLGIVLVLLFVVPASVCADKPIAVDSRGVEVRWASSGCTTIQSGALTYVAGHYLAGQPLQTGFDPYGTNYQAHIFNGYYANNYLGRYGFPPYEGDAEAYLADNPDAADTWYWPYRDAWVTMKWDDNWLANTDCDGDGVLDRHYGYSSYIGCSAWLTNHQRGVEDGQNWTYFIKIVAVPGDATLSGDVWYAADGTEIGPVIWGVFAIIEEVASGEGAYYVSPAGPGFGKW